MKESPFVFICICVCICLALFLTGPAHGSEQFSVHVGNYSSLPYALEVLDELRDKGIYCDAGERGNEYVVLCGTFAVEAEATALKQRLEALGYRDTFVISSSPALKEAPPEKMREEERPIGRERVTADILERKGGNLHPFLSVAEYYTDNTFNTRDDREGDSYTVISPGIWLLIPRSREYMIELDTGNTTPGGLRISRYAPRYPGRLQAYAVYRADIVRYSRFSSENTVSHLAEATFQYNFRGGLSIDLADQFVKSHNARGSGAFFELDKFTTNLINVIANYETGTRWRFRLDYANYRVNFAEPRNDFRDRTDNSLSAYAFYRIFPKTAIFAEYEFVDIDYNTDLFSDGKEHHLFGGVNWDIAAKSKGSVKAGYGVKEFSAPPFERSKNVLLEAQVDHKFTPKTSVKLLASRRTNESDIAQVRFVVSNSISAEYLQRMTPKISGSINLSYATDRYSGELTFGGETQRLQDTYYKAGGALQYEFRDWLKAAVGYGYTKRVSNFSLFDYTTNTVYARVTGTL